MSLTGKVALITGASNGIGKTVALRLAADGASVIINYHTDAASASALVAQIGPDRALAVQADVSDLASIDKLVSAAVARFGKIDIVMPNGTSSPTQPTDPLLMTMARSRHPPHARSRRHHAGGL